MQCTLAASTAGVFLPCVLLSGQSQPFVSRVDVVTVDVAVLSGGKPVVGLSKEDFELRDNGVLQDVTLISSGDAPVNVVLALDISGSVRGERLQQLESAAEQIRSTLLPSDRAVVLSFARRVSLTGFPAPGVSAGEIARESLGLETSLVDAVYAGLVMAESDTGQPIVVVFTDGEDTSSFLPASAVSEVAKRVRAAVFVVTPNNEVSGIMADVARLTGGEVLTVESAAAAGNTISEVIRAARRRYVLAYTPKRVPERGWHQIRVRLVGRRDVEVKARPGYTAAGE